MKETNYKVIEVVLFSGIGGFSLGLKRAGFEIDHHYFSEIDKHAVANYSYNFKNNSTYVGSVKNVRGIIRTVNERRDHNTRVILTFGSPCQDFSLAGKRKGLNGDRSSLIRYALFLIKWLKPDVYIWENVKGAFSSNDGADFWAILQAFANLGDYTTEWQLLNTSWFLPQNRERIYAVGHLAGRSLPGVFPFREDDPGFAQRAAETPVVNCLTAGGHSGGLHSSMTLVQYVKEHGYIEWDEKGNVKAPRIIAQRGRPNGSGKNEQQFEERADGLTNTITGVQKDNYVRITPIGNIYPSGHEAGNVYDIEGISPTLKCNGPRPNMNNICPKIQVNSGVTKGYEEAEPGDSISLQHPTSNTRKGRVGKKVAQTLDTGCSIGVVQVGTSTKSGGTQPYQQDRVYDVSGLSPALDTRSDQKNILVQPVQIGQSSQTFAAQHGSMIGENGQDAFTIRSAQPNGVKVDTQIRRLTEIECERLQGFPDNWTKYGLYNERPNRNDLKWREQNPDLWAYHTKKVGEDYTFREISRTQRYKMCGNAVTVDVVEAIGKRLKFI